MVDETLAARWPIVQIPNGDARVTYCEISGCPGYAVGNDGSVWTQRKVCNTPGVMRGVWRRMRLGSRRGYPSVSLRVCGRHKNVRVHQLVLLAFVGPRPTGAVARHADGDKKNNRPDNLCWGTQKENCGDMIAHGRSTRGAKSGRTVLTEEIVREIRQLRKTGIGADRISKKLGVTASQARHVIYGHTWGWLK